MIYSRSNTLESNVYKKSFVDYKTGIKPEEEEEEEEVPEKNVSVSIHYQKHSSTCWNA